MTISCLMLYTFLSIPTTIESNPSKLNDPISIEVNNFDLDAAKEFEKQMDLAQYTGQKLVPIVIDSYGGSVRALLRMVDVILASKVPVATVCVGKCMSCGAILFAMGSEGMRYASPNSTILFHEISGGTDGKLSDIKTSTEEMERLNVLLFRLISDNTGHNKDFFFKKVMAKHTDWYLTPEEALKLNVVNHIGLPSLKVKLKATYILE